MYKEKNKNNEDKNSNLNNTKNKKKQNNNKEKNKKEENKNNINEIINDEEKLSNNNEVKSENNEGIKYMIPKQEKNCNENNKNPKKEKSDKNVNFNINIQRIKVSNKTMALKSKSNTKLMSPNSQEITKKKYKELMNLTKSEQNNFNQIKNIMRNYYINFAYNDPLMGVAHIHPNLFKTDFNNIKQNNNNNIAPIDFFKRYRNTRGKTFNIYKTIR